MRRTVLVAVLLLTGCGAAAETEPAAPARAAEPQHLELGWRESYPSKGEHLQLGANRAELSFGLMLFATGDLAELEQANREGRLPPVRLAATMKPPPPDSLAPGASWRATL